MDQDLKEVGERTEETAKASLKLPMARGTTDFGEMIGEKGRAPCTGLTEASTSASGKTINAMEREE